MVAADRRAKQVPWRHEICFQLPTIESSLPSGTPMVLEAAIDEQYTERYTSAAALAFYRAALAALQEAGVPFLLGGGYAFFARTAIARMTKDLDIFVLPGDVERALSTLAAAGYETELTSSHWLAKAWSGDNFIDLIFNSGNGCCPVDATWFEHATEADVMGLAVKLCPPEESIWQKSFIMERERYDGADVAFLLRSCGPALDWSRLIERFGAHWRVLLAHLILFGYVFPDRRSTIPAWVLEELTGRLGREETVPPQANDTCFGTLLSRRQYDTAVGLWGYRDARLPPTGLMNGEQVATWTAASEDRKSGEAESAKDP